MNTPTHLVVNLAILGRKAPPHTGPWIAAGALLPDVPIFVFYAWQRIALGASESDIWGRAYFEPSWQEPFDVFHSAPLFVGLALSALALRRVRFAWLCASVLLHCLGDAFVHGEDGHRHLWPLSDWRFLSSVSYWDPAHFGAWGAVFETLLIVASSVALWSAAGRASRAALVGLCVLSATAWVAFYGVGR